MEHGEHHDVNARIRRRLGMQGMVNLLLAALLPSGQLVRRWTQQDGPNVGLERGFQDEEDLECAGAYALACIGGGRDELGCAASSVEKKARAVDICAMHVVQGAYNHFSTSTGYCFPVR